MPIDIRPMELDEIKRYTDDFSEENLIGEFLYGKVFRGRDGDQELTVKVWDSGHYYKMAIELFSHVAYAFAGAPKPIGHCYNAHLGALASVFQLKAMDTVHNLIPKDDFSWTDRVKVALGLALGVRSIHTCRRPQIIRNLDAAHIMCDQEYNPTIYDLGLIFGGFRQADKGLLGSPGYIDPYLVDEGECTDKTDIFAYGVVLLSLITKRAVNAKSDQLTLYKWACDEYKRRKNEPPTPVGDNNLKKRKPRVKNHRLLVDLGKQKSETKNLTLVEDNLRKHKLYNSNDGYWITRLARRCVEYKPTDRPDIHEVVASLQELIVVKKHGDICGINKVLDNFDPDLEK